MFVYGCVRISLTDNGIEAAPGCLASVLIKVDYLVVFSRCFCLHLRVIASIAWLHLLGYILHYFVEDRVDVDGLVEGYGR